MISVVNTSPQIFNLLSDTQPGDEYNAALLYCGLVDKNKYKT